MYIRTRCHAKTVHDVADPKAQEAFKRTDEQLDAAEAGSMLAVAGHASSREEYVEETLDRLMEALGEVEQSNNVQEVSRQMASAILGYLGHRDHDGPKDLNYMLSQILDKDGHIVPGRLRTYLHDHHAVAPTSDHTVNRFFERLREIVERHANAQHRLRFPVHDHHPDNHEPPPNGAGNGTSRARRGGKDNSNRTWEAGNMDTGTKNQLRAELRGLLNELFDAIDAGIEEGDRSESQRSLGSGSGRDEEDQGEGHGSEPIARSARPLVHTEIAFPDDFHAGLRRGVERWHDQLTVFFTATGCGKTSLVVRLLPRHQDEEQHEDGRASCIFEIFDPPPRRCHTTVDALYFVQFADAPVSTAYFPGCSPHFTVEDGPACAYLRGWAHDAWVTLAARDESPIRQSLLWREQSYVGFGEERGSSAICYNWSKKAPLAGTTCGIYSPVVSRVCFDRHVHMQGCVHMDCRYCHTHVAGYITGIGGSILFDTVPIVPVGPGTGWDIDLLDWTRHTLLHATGRPITGDPHSTACGTSASSGLAHVLPPCHPLTARHTASIQMEVYDHATPASGIHDFEVQEPGVHEVGVHPSGVQGGVVPTHLADHLPVDRH